MSDGAIGLEGRRVAVVGGDEREQEVARLAAAAGAEVRAFGFPWPVAGIAGVLLAGSAEEALEGADYALFPIPGMGTDGRLYAPHATAAVVPDEVLLGRMRPGGTIIMGTADPPLRERAAKLGYGLFEYENDTELMLRRGPAIVEGAIAAAIANTAITIHAATAGVVGHGNIGRLLARTLVLLGARVHVFARNPVQRADAYTSGCAAHALDDLPALVGELEMLFSTVPTRVVEASILRALPPGALVMDLAAPPGGVDLGAAGDLGLRAVWARGMGKRAPVTVGRSQWDGIMKRIAEVEGGRADGR